jgi:hypothetical protein
LLEGQGLLGFVGGDKDDGVLAHQLKKVEKSFRPMVQDGNVEDDNGLNVGEQLGKNEGYTKEQIEEYRGYVNLIINHHNSRK